MLIVLVKKMGIVFISFRFSLFPFLFNDSSVFLCLSFWWGYIGFTGQKKRKRKETGEKRRNWKKKKKTATEEKRDGRILQNQGKSSFSFFLCSFISFSFFCSSFLLVIWFLYVSLDFDNREVVIKKAKNILKNNSHFHVFSRTILWLQQL